MTCNEIEKIFQEKEEKGKNRKEARKIEEKYEKKRNSLKTKRGNNKTTHGAKFHRKEKE